MKKSVLISLLIVSSALNQFTFSNSSLEQEILEIKKKSLAHQEQAEQERKLEKLERKKRELIHQKQELINDKNYTKIASLTLHL